MVPRRVDHLNGQAKSLHELRGLAGGHCAGWDLPQSLIKGFEVLADALLQLAMVSELSEQLSRLWTQKETFIAEQSCLL